MKYIILLSTISERFKYFFSPLTIFAIAWATVPLAIGQDGDFDALELLYGDEETVSIATGSAKPLYLAPSVATVITAEDIRAMGANNLDDVLESVPGLHISLGPRYSSLYSIRGIHTSTNPHVLMLINGYPITELYSGSRAPKLRIPIHNIKRVEVIRGPGSAVYGADAFAGVINVITDSVEDIEATELGVTLGSFDTTGISARSRTRLMGWDVGFSLEWEKSDGDSGRKVTRDLQTLLDSFFSTNASLAPGNSRNQYDVLNSQIQLKKNHWAVTLNSWRQDNAGIGVGIADALDENGYQDSTQHLLDLRYIDEDLGNDWEMQANLNYFYLKQRSYYTLLPEGTVLPIGADGNVDFTSANFVSFTDGLIGNPGATDTSLAAEIVFNYLGMTNHRFRLATGFKAQEIDTVETKNFGPGVIDGSQTVVNGSLTDVSDSPFVFLRSQDRDVYYVSIQDEWAFISDWELTAGVRFDDYSDFGNTVNPRLALVWQTNYRLTSKLLYGKAFRAPSFFELSAINNPVSLGNPNVGPEEIGTLELSFDYRHNYDVRAKINVFRHEIEGLIDFIPDPGAGISTAQNAEDHEGYGFEFELNWALSEYLSLDGSYSRQQSENSVSGTDIADAPQHLAFIGLRWQIDQKWFFSTQAHHVAGRSRVSGDVRAEIDDSNLFNLALYTQKLTERWDINLSIKNLFDEEAFEPGSAAVPIDHVLQGRSVMFNAEYRFAN